MANLQRTYRWESYYPDIGENLELPEAERLCVEVASGLPKAALSQLQRLSRTMGRRASAINAAPLEPVTAEGAEAQAAAQKEAEEKRFKAAQAAYAEDAAAAFEGVARLVGNHTICGRPVTCLRDYFAVLIEDVGGGEALIVDLGAEAARLNSLEGQSALFSARRSGGSASTGRRSAAKDSRQTGGR